MTGSTQFRCFRSYLASSKTLHESAVLPLESRLMAGVSGQGVTGMQGRGVRGSSRKLEKHLATTIACFWTTSTSGHTQTRLSGGIPEVRK